jgi:TonB family protein
LPALVILNGGAIAQRGGMNASPKRSWLISLLVHAAVFVLLVATGKVTHVLPRFQDHGSIVFPSDLVKYQVTRNEKVGGGGGRNEPNPPSKGVLPKVSPRPFVPPTTHAVNQQPVLSMDMAIFGAPAIAVPLLDLKIGDPNGVLGPASDGPGGPNGIGNHGRDGVGDRDKSGYGPGDEPGFGSATPGFRDDVTPPKLLSKIEPEYSDEARKAQLQGSVFLRIVVDERGHAESIEVTQGLGLGLDERAVEAVRKWRFRSAMRGKRPVPASAIVQVVFRLL